MSVEFIDPPLETRYAAKLEIYQDVHKDFYQAKARVQYLGQWLFQLSGELGLLRWNIARQVHDEQLEVFDKDEYFVGEVPDVLL